MSILTRYPQGSGLATRLFVGWLLAALVFGCSEHTSSKQLESRLYGGVGDARYFDLTDDPYVYAYAGCGTCLREPVCLLDGKFLGVCEDLTFARLQDLAGNEPDKSGELQDQILLRDVENGKHSLIIQARLGSGENAITESTFTVCRRTTEPTFSLGIDGVIETADDRILRYRSYAWNATVPAYYAEFTGSGKNGSWRDSDDDLHEKVTLVAATKGRQVYEITDGTEQAIGERIVLIGIVGQPVRDYYSTQGTQGTTAFLPLAPPLRSSRYRQQAFFQRIRYEAGKRLVDIPRFEGPEEVRTYSRREEWPEHGWHEQRWLSSRLYPNKVSPGTPARKDVNYFTSYHNPLRSKSVSYLGTEVENGDVRFDETPAWYVTYEYDCGGVSPF